MQIPNLEFVFGSNREKTVKINNPYLVKLKIIKNMRNYGRSCYHLNNTLTIATLQKQTRCRPSKGRRCIPDVVI